MSGVLRHGVTVLFERRDVVEHPEAAAVRGHNQVVVLHHEVVHRRERQIQLHRLPLLAIVEGNENAGLSAREEQASTSGIDTHGVDIGIRGKAIPKPGPSFTEVRGLENVWREVVQFMPFDSHVCGARIL